MKKLNQVKTAALISYFALTLNIALGFIYTPWMVGTIGKENYGLYTLATSVIAIFTLDFGLGSAVSRFVSKYRAENNQKGIENVLGAIYKLYIIIDIVICAVLVTYFFFLGTVYKELTPQELEKFKTLYAMVAFCSVVSFPFMPLDGILNAYEKLIQLKICSLFNKVISVALIVVALYFTNDVTAVVGANVLSTFMTVVMKFIIVKRSVPVNINLRYTNKETYKTLFGFTLWTTIISLMQRFTHSFAPSVLGNTSGSEEIAIYSPAVIIEGYYYTIATAIKGLFLPRISRFIAEKKENEILKLAIKLGRYQVITLGMIFIGFLCVGKEFMVLWMGPDFEKTYYCTIIILLPTLISSTQQIANTTVIAKNLVKYQARCMLVTGTLGLAISYITSLYIGSIGVCIGTAVASLVNTAYLNIVYIKKAGINMFEFYKKTYLRAIPAYVLPVLISWPILRKISLGGWSGFLIKGSIVVVWYVLSILFLYIEKEERRKLFSFIKGRILKRS